MMNGGTAAGGIRRRIVCDTAVTWASAPSTFTLGWKKILITATPGYVCDSIERMSLTTEEMVYSEKVVTREAMSSVVRPSKFQITDTTAMSISGKMSVGVVTIANTPSNRMVSPMTREVYGRRSARRTIHMSEAF